METNLALDALLEADKPLFPLALDVAQVFQLFNVKKGLRIKLWAYYCFYQSPHKAKTYFDENIQTGLMRIQ